MDPNLTCPIILNPAINVTLNASLCQPTQSGFIDWLKVNILGLAQVITAVVLAYYTYWLWRSTSSYAEQARTQTDIMQRNATIQQEQMAQNISLLRYHRLRDEMDKLVAPLYFAALSTNTELGKMGWFGLIPPAERYNPRFKHISEFLDGIKRNIYLSGDEQLTKDIMILFSLYDEYWKDQSSSSRRNYIEHLNRIVSVIKDQRYPTLKCQIEQTESELGVNIVP